MSYKKRRMKLVKDMLDAFRDKPLIGYQSTLWHVVVEWDSARRNTRYRVAKWAAKAAAL